MPLTTQSVTKSEISNLSNIYEIYIKKMYTYFVKYDENTRKKRGQLVNRELRSFFILFFIQANHSIRNKIIFFETTHTKILS